MTVTATLPTTTATTTEARAARTAGRVSWRRGAVVAVAAAAASTAVAGGFQAVGHTLSVTDGPIPLLAFGQMVLVFTVVGIVIARHTSRAAFLRVTVALTVLSCVPDLALGDGVLSKAGLALTHVVAAAIVIPRLARR